MERKRKELQHLLTHSVTVLYLKACFTSGTAGSRLTSWARITLGKKQRRVRYYLSKAGDAGTVLLRMAPQQSLGNGSAGEQAALSAAHLSEVWKRDTDPQGFCLPVPPSLLWSLAVLLVQALLLLPAQRKEKRIQHRAHLDVLRQRCYCYKPIKNTCLPGPREHLLNQHRANSVYLSIN